jgi:hypothetical protein
MGNDTETAPVLFQDTREVTMPVSVSRPSRTPFVTSLRLILVEAPEVQEVTLHYEGRVRNLPGILSRI